WKTNFCGEIGSLPGDDFVMNEDIEWSNTLLTKYNNSIAAVEELKKQFYPGPYAFTASRYISPTFANDYHQRIGGKSAEFRDWSNGAVFEKTIEQQQTTTVDFDYTTYNTYSNAFGLQTFVEGTITVPFVGTQITIAKTDISVGAKTTGMGSETTFDSDDTTNIATVYYKIDETDPGDNFDTYIFMGANHNHSPLFMFAGGETSCPPEQAMTVGHDVDPVSIDNPYIAVVNPISEAVIASGEENANHFAPPQYNLDSVAIFHIRIANNTSTTLSRKVEVFLDPASNPFGAEVKLGSTDLGNGNFVTQNTLAPGVSTPFILFVRRPIGNPFFDFENLKIGIRSECDSDGGDRNPLIQSKYIYVSAFFKTPCSPISITSPEDGFVVHRENINDLDDREEILFELRDYQSDNINLEEIQLQYQRLGTGIGWQDVPGGIISRSDLAASDAMLAAGQDPVYYFAWDITGAYNLYPDGDYKIRALAICNAAGQKYSNEVTGEISRTQIIVGNVEPADGIWTSGDEILISYSEMIDCGVINSPAYIDTNLILLDTTTGLEIFFVCT
ncbi:MAG: hypothetical protein AAGK97_09565, partial [Bacteroidota bacterium]